MKSVIYSLAISLVFTGFVFADQLTEKPLKDVKLDFTKVASDRLTYAIYMQSKNDAEKDLGYAIGEVIMNAMAQMTVELKVDVKTNEVVINQKFSMFGGYAEYSSVCKKNVFLSPRVAMLKTEQKNKINERKAVYENGQVTYGQDGQKREPIDFPEDTVIFMHLFRIIPQLPKDRGVIYTFENYNRFGSGKVLVAEEGNQFGIVYKGPQQIEIEGQKLELDRYDLVGDKYMCQLFINNKGQVNFVKTTDSLMTLLTPELIARQEKLKKERELKKQQERQKKLDDIFHVVIHESVEDLKRLLEKDPKQVNKRGHRETTPLITAAWTERYDIIKLLIEKGADINAKDKFGNTPLHKASGRIETLKMLVKAGVDINAKDGSGRNILYKARDVETFRFLLGKGADINARDKQENTILHNCTNTDIAGSLVSNGFGLESKNKRGDTPLHSHAWNGNAEMVEFLIAKGADINARNKMRYMPLGKLREDNVKIAQILIDSGASILGDKAGEQFADRVPLDYHVSKGHINVVKLMLDKIVKIDITAWQALSCAKSIQMIELLTSHGIDLKNIKLDNNRKLVHSYTRDVELLKYLLSKGVAIDVNNQSNFWKRTPLFSAIQSGNIESVKFLLELGSDTDLKDKNGDTPLDFAIKNNKQQVIDLLKKHGAKTSPKKTQ